MKAHPLAKYNHLRFRGMDRRRAFPAPSVEAIAAVHGSQPDDIAQWQQMNIVTVHHDPKGNIVRVDASMSTSKKTSMPLPRAVQGDIQQGDAQ